MEKKLNEIEQEGANKNSKKFYAKINIKQRT